MRDWKIQGTLQLQAPDGSFVEVTEWSKPQSSPFPGRVAIVSGDAQYTVNPGGMVEKLNDREYVVVSSGVRLTDITQD